jgi:hypothetical protein
LGYAQALHANSRIADARDILEQLRVYGLRLFRIDPENATNAKQYALVLLEKAKIDICQFEVDSAQQALAAAREVFLSFELDPPQDELLYASILSETIASDIALLMQSSHQAQMHWSEAKQLAAYPDSSFDPLQSILIERVSGLESVQLLNTGQRSVDELDKQSTITENLVAHALAGGSWKVH